MKVIMQNKLISIALFAVVTLVFLGCKDERASSDQQAGAGGDATTLKPRDGSTMNTGGIAMGCTDCPSAAAGSGQVELVTREQLCMPYDGVGLGYPPPDNDCVMRECGADCNPCLKAEACEANEPAYACNLWHKCVPVLE